MPEISDPWQAGPVSGSVDAFFQPSAPSAGGMLDAMVKPAAKEHEVYLVMPSSVTEGGTPKVATLNFAYAEKVSLTFKVTGYPKGRLVVPKTVKMAAGKKSVSFKFSVKDDKATTLNQLAGIKLSIPEYQFELLDVCPSFDNEKPPSVKLAIPSSFQEGDGSLKKATITLSRALDKDGFVNLTQSSGIRLLIPEQVLIPAGKKSVDFPISALENDVIEGSRSINLSVKAAARTLAQAKTTLLDNDHFQLTLDMPDSVAEGGVVSGKVAISGTMPKDLKVDLSAINGSGLSFPASVTISAGVREAVFSVSARQNTLRDGTRKTSVSAKAGDVSATARELVVMDDDVAGYRVTVLDTTVTPGQPIKIKVSAVDVEGNLLRGFAGYADLSSIISGGVNKPPTPSRVYLSSGWWSGKVTLPVASSLVTGLMAGDTTGRTSEINEFDSARTLSLKAMDLVADPVRNRIYAAVPGGPVHQVVAIDPISLQITGGVATGQTPEKLAITSGGEYLYATLKGNGTIAKINPSTMTVIATFPVGSDANGPLYAGDIAPVPGQPDLVLVTRSSLQGGTTYNSVAVYENGVPRQAVTPVRNGINFIQPSADPNVFFCFGNQYPVYTTPVPQRRMVKVGAEGVSELPTSPISRGWWYSGTRTYGNMMFFPEGDAVDGVEMRPLGQYSNGGSICPDVAGNRVFYLERYQSGPTSVDVTKIIAYDPVTQNTIDGLDMPAISEDPVDFIRWGENGLAFCTSDTLTLVNSPRLVPDAAATDLATNIELPSDPPAVGDRVNRRIIVTNLGPNTASSTSLAVRFSDAVEIKRASADKGLHEVISNGANLWVGELGAGKSASLDLTVISAKVASIGCTVSAASSAADPDFSNNASHALINYGHGDRLDAFDDVSIVGCGQVDDPTRNLIWISIPSSPELWLSYPPHSGHYEVYNNPVRRIKAPLSRSVVSMDPHTGKISKPIPLNADPTPDTMALSANGRYLYVGLRDIGEISRIDLQASPPQTARIILPPVWNLVVSDIEVLDGDGTSIIVATQNGDYVVVFDGLVPRPVKVERTNFDSIRFLGKTANPAVFTGVGSKLYRLLVSNDGVRITKSHELPVNGPYDSSGTGELWMWDMNLLEVDSLAQVANLWPWAMGLPILENTRNRVYFLDYFDQSKIHGFDTLSHSKIGELKVAGPGWQSGCRSFMRWGNDGFSILKEEKIILARWALANPVHPARRMISQSGGDETNPAGDADGDGIPYAFELFFGTSPLQPDPNPVKLTTATAGGKTVIHLTFPRRVGMSMPGYGYEISPDLIHWNPVEGISETVLSLQQINGMDVENIEAAFAAPDSGSGFVRLRW